MGSKTAEVVVLGTLKEFVKNERYFRYSKVGMEYSNLTDLGKERLIELMSLNLALLRDSIEYDIEDHARELMMDNLKA